MTSVRYKVAPSIAYFTSKSAYNQIANKVKWTVLHDIVYFIATSRQMQRVRLFDFANKIHWQAQAHTSLARFASHQVYQPTTELAHGIALGIYIVHRV